MALLPIVGSCGSEKLANDLLPALTDGKDFTLPVVDIDDPQFQIPSTNPIATPEKLTNADLTSRQVGGEGTFDAIMAGMSAHLKKEFEQNRITGEQYTKAFIALTESALSNAVQYLLGRDQAYWQGISAQLQAQIAQANVVEARVKLEIAKTQLQMTRFEANTVEANYALIKMKLATESIQYCTTKFTLDQLMPEQKVLIGEQIETARAQTLNHRRDADPITGTLGKQRDLYEQQITSYKRDAEVKAVKIFSDAWITMKTLDEGLLPPSGFTNASLDALLTDLKTNLQIG